MVADKLPIVVLAGFSCAGKTTISKKLASHFGFDLMEQYVIYSSLAHRKGFQRTRHWLANVGREVFVKETTLENIRRIKALKKCRGVIIDASYGPIMDSILRSNLKNAQLITIAVKAGKKKRSMRIGGRMSKATDKEAQNELNFRDKFLSKVDLEKVMDKPSFEVTNEGELEDTLKEIVEKLSRLSVVKP